MTSVCMYWLGVWWWYLLINWKILWKTLRWVEFQFSSALRLSSSPPRYTLNIFAGLHWTSEKKLTIANSHLSVVNVLGGDWLKCKDYVLFAFNFKLICFNFLSTLPFPWSFLERTSFSMILRNFLAGHSCENVSRSVHGRRHWKSANEMVNALYRVHTLRGSQW